MKEESRLLIIEGVVLDDTSRHHSKDTDLFLMTLFADSEWTQRECKELAKESGFAVTRTLSLIPVDSQTEKILIDKSHPQP